MNALFLFRMERILAVYARPYNPKNPVLCYDERPCFLIGELIKGIEMKADQVKKEHYAYEKNGSCSLLESIEPLTGKRIADVFDQRRKVEFAAHFQKVAAEYAEAEKITVVLDNLNTHNESSFYEAFSAEEAKRLSDKFEFIYTPPKASWLNMIEIEFSAVSRLCLDRRIASKEELEKQVLAIAKERSEKEIKINWQFSIKTARTKLNRHYKKVNLENEKYLEI
jgi:DNA-binding CsgD family transcriptional regulator